MDCIPTILLVCYYVFCVLYFTVHSFQMRLQNKDIDVITASDVFHDFVISLIMGWILTPFYIMGDFVIVIKKPKK